MVAHHQETVAAARQLARSERPQMRAFGRRIVATQSAQIEQMKGWLAAWYAGRSVGVGYRPMMRDLTGLSVTGWTGRSSRTCWSITWRR